MGRLTLFGMYQYDNEILDQITMPDGFDLNTFKALLIEECGMLYPFHQSVPYFKANVKYFFSRNKYRWERLYQAFTMDYNPIENYDRHEDWTDTPDVTHTMQSSGKDSGSFTNEMTNENMTLNANSAYNSSDYSPLSKIDDTNTGQQSGSNTTDRTDNRTEHETGTHTHSGHIHGNIGVTKNSDMVLAEMDVRKIDLYKVIVNEFSEQFLIGVF